MNGIKYRSVDEMKDSGIEWLGEIPKYWTPVFLKRYSQINNGREIEDEDKDIEKPVPVFGSGGEFKRTSRVLHDGESVLFGRKGTIGKVLYVNGKFWTVDTMYYLTFSRQVFPRFVYFQLGQFPWNMITTQTALPSVVGSDVKNSYFVFPDVTEQRKIANFLDIKTAQFDSIIAKKEQLIAKLEEAKKSLISEVVTGKVKIVDGKLVPRQPEEMKDSGVEWLGMIPKEWSVRKFSHIIAIANGQVDPRISPFKEMILIAPNHIESNTGRILNLQSAEDQSADSGKYFCDKGDVIYSKIRPALCKACIAPMDCLTSADMYPMKADKKLLMNEWFLMILLSDNFTSAVILDSDRVAMPKVNRDSLSSYKLPVPSLLEQKSILSLIVTKQFEMDSVLEKTNLQISLLKSAKQSLISEAVTGKIDLRDWEINEQGGAS